MPSAPLEDQLSGGLSTRDASDLTLVPGPAEPSPLQVDAMLSWVGFGIGAEASALLRALGYWRMSVRMPTSRQLCSVRSLIRPRRIRFGTTVCM